MQKLSIEEINKEHKPNPIFDGMPESLKDPACFEDIEKRLRSLLISDHKHKTIKAYIACKRCQTKLNKKREVMKEIGFKDVKQYSEWRRIMSIISQKRSFQLR